MALANFFNKTALAASQILQGYDRGFFEDKLMNSPVDLSFDELAIVNYEGRATLDIAIRLLARLYPKIHIKPLDAKSETYTNTLVEIAQKINPEIELDSKIESVATIVVGATTVESNMPVFYIGSSGWNVLFSPNKPVGCGKTSIPFAAGASACFGAANLFRFIFSDQLENSKADAAFNLSLLDFTFPETITAGPELDYVNIKEVILVGLGAIGNGFVWALSQMPEITGTLHLVDKETVDLSNLQRYILTTQNDEHTSKVDLCKSILDERTRLDTFKHSKSWAQFLHETGNWKNDFVAVGVDTAADRIAIQASLPKRIINAWTQPADLGISRHYNFEKDACLACVYPPKGGLKPESQLISEALSIPEREMDVRELLYSNAPLDISWITLIANRKRANLEDIIQFEGMPLRTLYHQAVCSGILMSTTEDRQTETPMAFQSALAGIILASEIIIESSGIAREKMPTMTRINLLKPITNILDEMLIKRRNGKCICQDNDFIKRYTEKYNP